MTELFWSQINLKLLIAKEYTMAQICRHHILFTLVCTRRKEMLDWQLSSHYIRGFEFAVLWRNVELRWLLRFIPACILWGRLSAAEKYLQAIPVITPH